SAENNVKTRGVEYPKGLGGRNGKPAEMTSRRHRPDVYVAIERVLLHPNPVSQERSSGEWGTRVHRQYANPLPARAQSADQTGDLCRLTNPKHACSTDSVRV